jgi:two-component system chemotaxis sensor kinase CheA
LVQVGELFRVAGGQRDPTKGLVVLVELEGGEKLGLVVDEMLGQAQVVIKSLEANYGPVEGVSAATILGDGLVALILDVDALPALSQPGKKLPSVRQDQLAS